MAIIDGEKYGTRSLGGDNAERVYIIREANSDLEALTLLLATAPESISNGLKEIPRDIDNIEVLEIDDAQGIYEGTVPYKSGSGTETDEVGEYSFSYDIGTTNFTRKYSLSTYDRGTFEGQNARNWKQAINVIEGDDARVEGVQYQVPVMQGNITKRFSEAEINDSYIGDVYKCVGTVNSSYFQGLQAGEGLLTKVDLRSNEDGTWTGTFGYSISPNENNLAVSDELVVPFKRGWDYLWVNYRNIKGQFGPAQEPWQWNIEVIYKYQNWGVLNLG